MNIRINLDFILTDLNRNSGIAAFKVRSSGMHIGTVQCDLAEDAWTFEPDGSNARYGALSADSRQGMKDAIEAVMVKDIIRLMAI
jgi:hypothetical protein